MRDIFRKRLEGFSASHIADELNRMGILSPLAYKRNHGMPHAKGGYTDRKDCKWSATTIIRILQDETYTGTLVQGKQTTPHFKLKEREDKPSSEWVRVEGTHEAIIQKHDLTWCSGSEGLIPAPLRSQIRSTCLRHFDFVGAVAAA